MLDARLLPHRLPFLFVLIVILSLSYPVFAQTRSASPSPESATKQFDSQIKPMLAKHCLACHGPEKPKGDTRLDQLSADFSERNQQQRWLRVLEQLKSGAMPPKEKPRLSESELKTLVGWIQTSQAEADTARLAQGRTVLRRLNRVEYQNTLRDLLGVESDLRDLLPVDSSAAGFDNVGEALHTSSFLMEKYLEATDLALNLAIANGPQPPLLKKRYSLKDQHQVKVTTEKVFRVQADDTVVMFCSSLWQAVQVAQFYPPDRGLYRFRISASAVQSEGKPVPFRVQVSGQGLATKNQKSHLIGYFDATPDKPALIEFVDNIEARNTISILPYGLTNAQTVSKVGADAWEGPGVAIHYVEVEGPIYESWPPPSHRKLFGEQPQGPAPSYNFRSRVEIVSKEPEADAVRILTQFAKRAYRRPVTEKELQPFLGLVKSKLEQKQSFEQAVRAGLSAVLLSPEFLFLRESPGKLDDFALASRLSYFLWSSMPDEELLALAEQKKLHEPTMLRKQVERLLKDPKASAFTENFVSQWLGLRDIDFTEPSQVLYPEYDQLLRASMVRETELFFAEVLKNNLSISNFIASDFSLLNERLAKHYGIEGVTGWEMRKVKLPADSHRGGVLTMASVLKVTANGTTTSPVTRGAWVLERILGTPPPKPPEGVSALEPDIRGATTIREQLAKHRQVESCASCHNKIDPPGFALESFDVIGGWRDHYRTTGRGKPVVVAGRRMAYHEGAKVDPSDVMPGGQRFTNIDELKQILLKDKDQLARALTEKLLTYATGGSPAVSDQPEIAAIVAKLRPKEYGFRELIHEIVQSKVFQTK